MEIKNTTTFSKEGYFSLNKSLQDKIIIPVVAIELVLLAFALFLLIGEHDYLKSGILGLLMIIYPFVLLFIMNLQVKRNYNINKVVYDTMTYDYLFTDEKLFVTLHQKEHESKGHITYRAMYKVIDTPKFLFIFISSNQAYLIQKDRFESIEEYEKVIERIKKDNVKYKFKKIKVKAN